MSQERREEEAQLARDAGLFLIWIVIMSLAGVAVWIFTK